LQYFDSLNYSLHHGDARQGTVVYDGVRIPVGETSEDAAIIHLDYLERSTTINSSSDSQSYGGEQEEEVGDALPGEKSLHNFFNSHD